MKKENMHLRLLRYVYDIVGELDQDSYTALTNFGNNMYMLFMVVIVGTLLASLLLGEELMGLGLFLTFIYSQFKQERLIKELGLDKLVVGKADLKVARQKMMKRTLFQTLQIALFSIGTSIAIWRAHIPQESGTSVTEYIQFVAPMTVALLSLIGFVCLYVANRKKIKLT